MRTITNFVCVCVSDKSILHSTKKILNEQSYKKALSLLTFFEIFNKKKSSNIENETDF